MLGKALGMTDGFSFADGTELGIVLGRICLGI